MRTLAILAVLVATPALAADPVTGTWLTDTKDGIIEIAPCGNALCGKLARSLVPIKPPGTDFRNPDPKLRSRPILGVPILTGFVQDGEVWRGTAYDPKAGKSYNTTLQRVGPDTLKVRGCVAFFCRSIMWSRVK